MNAPQWPARLYAYAAGAKRPTATVPHAPHAGSTAAHPAVIETSPARTPLQTAPRSQTPDRSFAATVTRRAAAQGAIVVVTATRPASRPNPLMPRVDPQLNPYHPNQRTKVPSAMSVKLCIGIGRTLPSAPNRPVRGPTTAAPTRAAMPPVMCTIVLPAKSIAPPSTGLRASSTFELKGLKAPVGLQPQWTTTG